MTSARVKWEEFNRWWKDQYLWVNIDCEDVQSLEKVINDKLKELQKGGKK